MNIYKIRYRDKWLLLTEVVICASSTDEAISILRAGDAAVVWDTVLIVSPTLPIKKGILCAKRVVDLEGG